MHNFSWLIPGVLAGSDRPYGLRDLQRMAREGVRVLVTVMEESLDPEEVAAAGMEYHHLPVSDFGTPTMEQLDRFVKLVDENRNRGRPVAVHCLMGWGRTGTFLAAYLISQGMDFREAVREVRRRRPGSIETSGQLEILRRFAAWHVK